MGYQMRFIVCCRYKQKKASRYLARVRKIEKVTFLFKGTRKEENLGGAP